MSDNKNILLSFDFKTIEKKWQDFWLTNHTYKAKDGDTTREKKYILVEFPFPSGASLHVGHVFRYTVPDIYSRFLRQKGYNVLFPMGWDAFGLPAEEYARKTGQNPRITTEQNIAGIKQNIQKMGYSIDWNREFSTLILNTTNGRSGYLSSFMSKVLLFKKMWNYGTVKT